MARSRNQSTLIPDQHSLAEVKRFGEALIRTNDLDPVYVALHAARLKPGQLKRLLLAYWCFYHLGVSAWLSEHEDHEFWELMLVAAENRVAKGPQKTLLLRGLAQEGPDERWPRGAERRHFRGRKCLEAIQWLRASPRPEYFVDQLLAADQQLRNSVPAELIMDRVQKWPLFGPWIAFKVADMLERLFDIPISFPKKLTIIYAEPRAALDLLPGDPVANTNALIKHFGGHAAPPRYERNCNVQEVETILCKWKSLTNKHYWLGKDIHEIREGLKGWGRTADLLRAHCPLEVVA